MPIHQAEPNIFPQELLTAEHHESAPTSWWVLHTKPRQEKAVARELLARETPFYLPLMVSTSLIRGRRMEAYVPLFSGYVFMLGTEEHRFNALKTNRLANLLPVTDGEQLRCDLAQIQQLIATRSFVTLEQRIGPGRRVRVKSGSLKGLEGIVTERRKKRHLIVVVRFLQQGASVELEDWQLEPIN